MSLWWVFSAVFLIMATLLEDGWIWFLMAGRGLGGDGRARRRGRQGRLLANLLLSLSGGALLVAALQTGPGPLVLLFSLGMATLGAGLAGVSWRSPATILGRAVMFPLLPLAWILDKTVGWITHAQSPDDHSWELEAWEFQNEEGEAERALASLEEFRSSLVEDVMVPREEVGGLKSDWTVTQAVEAIGELGFSRYPVYADSLDAVTGVLHVFDLLAADPHQTINRYVRKPFMTTETKPITSLLKELQQSYNQMAIVVDEMGGTAGLVTVEDLLEELVGEIEDESDDPETHIKLLEPGVYWINAAIRIEDLNESLGLRLPEGEYDTVGGLILEHLERIPKIRERVSLVGVSFEVVLAEAHRIDSLKLTLEHPQK